MHAALPAPGADELAHFASLQDFEKKICKERFFKICMKVCIMCGGEGTRLRPLTFDRPKPCIPIVNTPSLHHLIAHLSHQGFNEVVITLGYRGEKIMDSLGDGSLFGVQITYYQEKTKLGTAGSVKNAEESLRDGPFLVVGGDHVTDIDLFGFSREHLREGGIVTVGFVSIDDPTEYGIAEIDSEFVIKRFKEKPAPGEIFSNLASTGMYVCNPEIFDYIPSRKKFDFARDLFPLLMREGYRLQAWLARGHWTDVGSPRALREAEHWKLQGMPYTQISGEVSLQGARIMGPLNIGGGVFVGRKSRIIGPVFIGEGTVIGEEVLIGPYTSIGAHCQVKDGSRVFSSSLYNGVTIGNGTTISGSIIDDDTVIGDGCSIEHDTVIGPRCDLASRVVVHSGTRIWPEVKVGEGEVVREHLLNRAYDLRTGGS
jgi:mannose-1-phosphate guanylyltransferase